MLQFILAVAGFSFFRHGRTKLVGGIL